MKSIKRLPRFALALVPLLIAASARADVLVVPRNPWPTETPAPIPEVTTTFDPGLLLPLLLIVALLIVTALLVRWFTRREG